MTFDPKSNAFEILKLRFEDQTSLLRKMTEIDLQVMTGFATVQLVFSAWLSQAKISSCEIKLGFLIITVIFSLLTIKILYNNYQRRNEVVSTVKNLNSALGLSDADIFITGKAINAKTKYRPWFWPYIVGVICIACGTLIVLFG